MKTQKIITKISTLIALSACSIKTSGPSPEIFGPEGIQEESETDTATESNENPKNENNWKNPLPATSFRDAKYIYCQDKGAEVFLAIPHQKLSQNSYGMMEGEVGNSLLGFRSSPNVDFTQYKMEYVGISTNGPVVTLNTSLNGERFAFSTENFRLGKLEWKTYSTQFTMTCTYYKSEGYKMPEGWEL